MFLDNGHKCLIYEKRPLICSLYPILWEEQDGVMNYFADFACPLAHITPVHDLYNWVKEPSKKKLIEILGELEFESNLIQYVNISKITDEVYPAHLLELDGE